MLYICLTINLQLHNSIYDYDAEIVQLFCIQQFALNCHGDLHVNKLPVSMV